MINDNLFKLEIKRKYALIHVVAPQGFDQDSLIQKTSAELKDILPQLYGKHVKLNGRLNTSMALCLGHELAQTCRSVSVFDPISNKYVIAICH